MAGLRRWVVAVVAALVAGVVSPSATLAAEPRPITVSDITAEGVAIDRVAMINRHGQMVVGTEDEYSPPGSLDAVWDRGTVSPIRSEGGSGVVYGFSDRGQVVGISHVMVPGQGFPKFQPFSWFRGEYTELRLPTDGHQGFALAVNNRGQILGDLFSEEGDDVRRDPVMWERGELLMLGDEDPPIRSPLAAINNRGQIGLTLSNGHAAIRQPDGRITELGNLGGDSCGASAINDRGEVVGSCRTAEGTRHAVLWRGGETIDLGTLGGDTSSARALTDRGHVIGQGDTPEGTEHAFLWRDGEMIDLGPGEAMAVNNSDQVVRNYGSRAFLWDDGHVTDLGELATDDGMGLAEAFDINDRGQITGFAGWVQDGWSRRGGRPVLWTAPPRRGHGR